MNRIRRGRPPVRWPLKIRTGSLVRQFIPIEPELVAGTSHLSWIESWRDPPRGTSDFRPSRWTVTYVTFAALMLVQIEPAPVLSQPFSKSRTLR